MNFQAFNFFACIIGYIVIVCGTFYLLLGIVVIFVEAGVKKLKILELVKDFAWERMKKK